MSSPFSIEKNLYDMYHKTYVNSFISFCHSYHKMVSLENEEIEEEALKLKFLLIINFSVLVKLSIKWKKLKDIINDELMKTNDFISWSIRFKTFSSNIHEKNVKQKKGKQTYEDSHFVFIPPHIRESQFKWKFHFVPEECVRFTERLFQSFPHYSDCFIGVLTRKTFRWKNYCPSDGDICFMTCRGSTIVLKPQ